MKRSWIILDRRDGLRVSLDVARAGMAERAHALDPLRPPSSVTA